MENINELWLRFLGPHDWMRKRTPEQWQATYAAFWAWVGKTQR